VRPGRFDFYYRGGRLFEFDGKDFATHIKYAAVLSAGAGVNYIHERDLKSGKVQPVPTFEDGYERIKENCARYAGLEALGVADVCDLSSFACCNDDVVVLDIEVSLGSSGTGTGSRGDTQNRIDLLLYNQKKQELRFYEAKHFSNSDLWASPGRRPKVIGQMERYNRLVARKSREILRAYQQYVKTANRLFLKAGVRPLPMPATVDQKVVLFVFGYDRDQLARLKRLLINRQPHASGRKPYNLSLRARGSTKDATADLLWKAVRTIEIP